jgi:hypothetical protein
MQQKAGSQGHVPRHMFGEPGREATSSGKMSLYILLISVFMKVSVVSLKLRLRLRCMLTMNAEQVEVHVDYECGAYGREKTCLSNPVN